MHRLQFPPPTYRASRFRLTHFPTAILLYSGYRPVESVGSEPGAKPVYGAYNWFSYEQVERTAQHIGSGLVSRGLVEANDTGLRCVGVYAKTRIEMVLAEAAIMRQGFVDVALYDTLGAEAVAFIVAQTQMRVCFVGAAEAPKLLAMKAAHAERMASLRAIVQFEAVTEEQRAKVGRSGEAGAGLSDRGASHLNSGRRRPRARRASSSSPGPTSWPPVREPSKGLPGSQAERAW